MDSRSRGNDRGAGSYALRAILIYFVIPANAGIQVRDFQDKSVSHPENPFHPVNPGTISVRLLRLWVVQ